MTASKSMRFKELREHSLNTITSSLIYMKVLQIIFKFFRVHGRARGQKIVWYFYFSLSTHLLIYFTYFVKTFVPLTFHFWAIFATIHFFKGYLFQFPVFLFFVWLFPIEKIPFLTGIILIIFAESQQEWQWRLQMFC